MHSLPALLPLLLKTVSALTANHRTARPYAALKSMSTLLAPCPQERRATLERYLNRLAAHPAAANSEALLLFLTSTVSTPDFVLCFPVPVVVACVSVAGVPALLAEQSESGTSLPS